METLESPKYERAEKRSDKQWTAQHKIFENLWGFLKEYSRHPIGEGSMLEFGAGRFGYVDFYKQHFRRSFALDIYDFSESYDENVEFVISENERTIPLPDRSIDLVVSHSVLEHVVDIEQTIREINRILKIGGTAYLTVSPLYWSGCGSHLYTKDRKRLSDWEHLDPESEYFLETGDSISFDLGGWLNKLTSSQLLAEIGKVAWTKERYETRADVYQKRPGFLNQYDRNPLDFHAKEFRLIARKVFDFDSDGMVIRNVPS